MQLELKFEEERPKSNNKQLSKKEKRALIKDFVKKTGIRSKKY